MPTISEIRQKYPQYQDMSDDALADALHKKFYSDMPRDQFNAKIGLEAGAPPSDDALSQVRTATGGFLEGIPVVGPMIRGGVERAAAATLAPFSDKDYGDILKRIQAGSAAEKEANPVLDTGSQIAGAIGGTLPLVAAAPAAFGASKAPMLSRMLAGGASGSALGGADAAVRSGGDPSSIANGAAWGLGLGASGAPIGAAVGKGMGAVASRFRSGATPAQRLLSEAAGADNVTDMAPQLSKMGRDAMPMDLGPNLQRQAGALASIPGEAQQTVRSAIASRQAGSGGRVTGALDSALGQPVDTIAVADDIIAKRAAASKPLYDAAYAQPVPYTKELESLLKRPSVGRAMSKARGLAADEGVSSKQWFANIADDGTVTIKNTPDVRQLDLTKRALDDMISAAQRGGNNNEARILTQTKNRLVGMIDDAVPVYAKARAAYSGPSGVLDAIEEGQKAFSSNLTPNQLRTQIMKMGDAEKDAFLQGSRAKIAQIMGTARNDALAARTAFMKGYNKEKLEILVGKQQAQKMLDALEAETAFTKTRDVVTGNSETAARLAARQAVGQGESSPSVLRSIGNLRVGDAVMDIGGRLVGAARNSAQSKVNSELATLLSSKDPVAITRALEATQAAQKRGDISAQRAKEIIQSLMLSSAERRQPLGIPAGR